MGLSRYFYNICTIIEMMIPAEYQICITVFLQSCHLFQIVRLHIVITVREKKEFSFCCPDSRISCRGYTAVSLMNHPETGARMILSQLVAKLFASIGRTIIHQNDFQILSRLAKPGIHTALQ